VVIELPQRPKEVFAVMRFGERLRSLRLAQDLSLREFCLKHGYDPSNMSKIERGRMAPPQKPEQVEQLAARLGLRAGSREWQEFMDSAAAEAGRIPEDILSDEKVLGKLPVLFRAARGQKVSREDIQKLVESIRKA
jgi:transcriptional regulator with XRE-family HTH domain